jgi:hypothetical protein
MSETIYRLDLDPSLDPSPVLPALIWAEGIAAPLSTEESPVFLTEIMTQAAVTGENFVPDELPRRKQTGYQGALQTKPPQGAGNQTQRD